MKNTSMEYRKRILNDRNFLYMADISFSDGTKMLLNDKRDLMSNGIKISSSTSGMNSFDIGAAVIGELELTLNNESGKFDTYDFLDAEINLKIGLQLDENRTEYLQMGVYSVDETSAGGITIVLSALDRMSRFEREYSEVSTSYPTTLYQIVKDICVNCGVQIGMASFDNGNMIIKNRPEGENLSCLQIIAYAAQVAGSYVKMDSNGTLVFQWYQTDIFENSGNLDGGNFKYINGDAADGGDFQNYALADVVDGGTFEDQRRYAHIYAIGSLNIGTDEIVISGIRVIGTSDNSEDTEGTLYGEEGYVLRISENPFISVSTEKDIAAFVGSKIIGMKIRTFSVRAVSDPAIEAGDCAFISDRKGNSYPAFITHTTFKLSDYEEFSCGAETPSKKRSCSGISANTKAIIAARKEARKQISSYDIQVQMLTQVMANSFGVFKTEELQEDGSYIFYMHDKPTLSESQTIWKMAAGAVSVSTDGGITWNAGVTAEGNMITKVLSAIGINADWINAGTISADRINGGTLKIGGKDYAYGNIEFYNKENESVGRWNGHYLDTPALETKSIYFDINKEFTIGIDDGLKDRLLLKDTPKDDLEFPSDFMYSIINTPSYLYIGSSPNFIKITKETAKIEFVNVIDNYAGHYPWSIDSETGAADFAEYKKIYSGNVVIKPSAANTPTGAAVTFPDGKFDGEFDQKPYVTATPKTAAPGTIVLGVGVNGVSASGCTIWVTRTNTTETGVDYVAIQS